MLPYILSTFWFESFWETIVLGPSPFVPQQPYVCSLIMMPFKKKAIHFKKILNSSPHICQAQKTKSTCKDLIKLIYC